MTANFLTGLLLNDLLLLLPILLWNWAFATKLPKAFSPEYFERNIPVSLTRAENISRMVVFSLPILMPMSLVTPIQKLGLVLYLVGVGAYFLSWVVLMVFPQSGWSKSAAGFLAPAYTPLLWLTGIGLIGDKLFVPIPYWPGIYLICGFLFIVVHVSHTAMAYRNSN